MIRDGELERIYRRWGIWDDTQRELGEVAEAGRFYGHAAAADAAAGSEGPATAATIRPADARAAGPW